MGDNCCGQLGERTDDTPVKVSGLSDVIDVSAGEDHSLMLTSELEAWTWGGNYRNQLGIGTTSDVLVPIEVPGE